MMSGKQQRKLFAQQKTGSILLKYAETPGIHLLCACKFTKDKVQFYKKSVVKNTCKHKLFLLCFEISGAGRQPRCRAANSILNSLLKNVNPGYVEFCLKQQPVFAAIKIILLSKMSPEPRNSRNLVFPKHPMRNHF
jgi:hypothetical protein